MGFNTNQQAYQSLRDVVAERTRPLVVWIGSGLSVAAGLPTWHALRGQLQTSLRYKALSIDPPERDKLLARAEAIKKQLNHWIAFGMLQEALGETTYRETVRDALKNAVRVSVPQAYTAIWKLSVTGVVTLNLDRLATRAFSEQRRGKRVVDVNGDRASLLLPVLHTPIPFIANLHGSEDDATSWVLTHNELSRLMDQQGYRQFVMTCLTTCANLFVGITADDVAVGGHLERLHELKLDMPAHYWLTHRRDGATDAWAEKSGIMVIRYDPADDHGQLRECLKDLATYVPQEIETPPPVGLNRPELVVKELPPPEEIVMWSDLERIRTVLNAKAAELLGHGSDEDYDRYADFCRKYEEPIHRAWFTTTRVGNNRLLGYTLNKRIASGAFGQVFDAVSPDGERRAVKVLRQDIRDDPEIIKCFRRGVRSMLILRNHRIDGMVAYEEASEIPAFVAMEWIEGPNLSTAKNAKYLEDWDVVLRVAADLTKILRMAHALPERVLHRDLRPSNVMLRDFYTGDWQVVVLDFDLSWHRGALEGSIVHQSGVQGYLAPEQIGPLPNVSTRSAGVDSFGLGMTLYFLCSGEDPVPNAHRTDDWDKKVRQATARVAAPTWRSTPERFARLILAATRHRQVERWDVTQIGVELDWLRVALRQPETLRSAPMLAEEIAARSSAMSGYQWDADQSRAMINLPGGVQVSVAGEEARGSVRLRLQRTSTGEQEWKNVSKYLGKGARLAYDKLRAAGWDVSRDSGSQTAYLEAEMNVTAVASDIERAARAIDAATEELRF